LASIALCLATTIILKMQLRRLVAQYPEKPGNPSWALLTLLPLIWLLAVTVTAGVQKIFHASPRIGFLAAAEAAAKQRPALEEALGRARAGGTPESVAAAERAVRLNRVSENNHRVDAVVTGFFLILVGLVLGVSIREWLLLLGRRKPAVLREADPVWLPDYKLTTAPSPGVAGWIALGIALARELAGETAYQRARIQAERVCVGPESDAHAHGHALHAHTGVPCGTGTEETAAVDEANANALDRKIWVETLDARYRGVRRCC
ncbi:MAG: carbon starvation protein A, partial [Verrucomicrobiales bacterium]|nr:carbon starvation protein A [Verrucomicrobiales bacterium]